MFTPDNPPAFPQPAEIDMKGAEGMTLLDWFAGTLRLTNEDLVQFSEADDQDLLQRFGTPEEIEQGFTHVSPGQPMPVANIELRAALEARGRAALRYFEAVAMLRERVRKGGA